MNRVLIIEDDAPVSKMLYMLMKANELDAHLVSNGEYALKLLAEQEYVLIILDTQLNDIDVFELIERIRQSGSTAPIILISEENDEYENIVGLGIGADEYLIKPLNPLTLEAKVKALIRRSHCHPAGAESILAAGPFSYNTSTLRLFKNNKEIPLTGRENALMKLFLDNPDRVFSKSMIYEQVWGNPFVDENTVMVYINRLRQKIEDAPDKPRHIQNVRGVGYRFIA